MTALTCMPSTLSSSCSHDFYNTADWVSEDTRARSFSAVFQATTAIEEGLKEWDPAKDSTIEVCVARAASRRS